MVGALLFAAEEAPKVVAGPANAFTEVAWLIPALPAVAVLLIWWFGKRTPGGGAPIGILLTGVACAMSWIVLSDFIGGGGPDLHKSVEWFPFGGSLSLSLGMKIDGLTAIMFPVVTTVSLMVQIYSTGYMHGDKRYTWFFTCLNLFTASMLLLVISDNLLQMLIGWELVGVCSYLLIGFWWEEKENSNAAIKAFVTTKLGDVPFMIGIFVLFVAAGTFDIAEITELAHDHKIATFTLASAAILLFGGAIGKSAQFPLYVWLPDAMAGPTPVSALIHAATMVTAGVFMVGRLFPVFEASEVSMNVVGIIGAITMLMAALLAMVQDDIKKVLAYSTISQLAYMMAAMGVGAGNAGIFHLFTHAWFKALLFLGAGSMIHAVHSNNMSEMGGLRKFMPITYKTFLIGSVALAGIPPLAGFWSKDEILTEAYRVGAGTAPHSPSSDWLGFVVYGVGILTAFLTAFYMSRAVHLSFFGEYRGHGHPHESPKTMTGPLMLLAGLSLVAGFVGVPWWKKGFGAWVGVGGITEIPDPGAALIAVSVVVAIAGIALGRKMYAPAPAVEPLKKLGWLYTLLVNKYYLDNFYYKAFVYPVRDTISRAMYWLNQNVFDGAVNGAAATARASARGLYHGVDQKVIDGAVNGAGIGTQRSSTMLRYVQSGDVQRYAAILFVGVVVLAFLFTRF